ncbi:DUF3099 domain-containing protein [Micromonospora sp. NPDC023956]|uniref:DUF3099 domain-containing protein n=1 Tax=Micromonospora sp. NPDC023956 TaxID=3155722 RepID=UPI0033E384CD
MKRQAYEPILITDAPRSQDDQLTSRQRRYVAMMSVRAACLVVGAVLVGAQAPLLWLWLPLCGVGMVLIPWLAVLIANDRPPKEEHRLFHRPSRREAPPPRSLAATEERPHRVIDAEL